MIKKCTQCGAELREGIMFCTECGAKIEDQPQNMPAADICKNCGATLKEEIAFCTECGTKRGETGQQKENPASAQASAVAPQQPPTVTAPVYSPPPQQNYYQAAQPAVQLSVEQAVKGTKYEPITTGGFIGIMLLLCIPVIGFILLIVWACGGCRKISKRSFARASLILAAIMLVLSLIAGLVLGSIFNSVLKEAGLNIGSSEGVSDWLENEPTENDLEQEDLISGLGELEALLNGLTAQEGMEGSLEGLIGRVEDANKDAEANSDGWPKALRKYPSGTATSVESYRTEITGTTLDEMTAYIEDLKKDGYEYRDFYNFGFSEEDMLAMNGWWGTNGEIYLSLSFTEGTVTVDHTYELPDLNFG